MPFVGAKRPKHPLSGICRKIQNMKNAKLVRQLLLINSDGKHTPPFIAHLEEAHDLLAELVTPDEPELRRFWLNSLIKKPLLSIDQARLVVTALGYAFPESRPALLNSIRDAFLGSKEPSRYASGTPFACGALIGAFQIGAPPERSTTDAEDQTYNAALADFLKTTIIPSGLCIPLPDIPTWSGKFHNAVGECLTFKRHIHGFCHTDRRTKLHEVFMAMAAAIEKHSYSWSHDHVCCYLFEKLLNKLLVTASYGVRVELVKNDALRDDVCWPPLVVSK